MKSPGYPNYKPSRIDWLGEVPEHWDVKGLTYIGEWCNRPSFSERRRGSYFDRIRLKPIAVCVIVDSLKQVQYKVSSNPFSLSS